MNLNFLGIGNSGHGAAETKSGTAKEAGAAGSDYAKNVQNMQAIRHLNSGQIVSGRVVYAADGEIQIALNQDQVLTARMEQQLEAAIGKMMSFEVKRNGFHQLSLRPLYANLAQNPAAMDALDAAGLPLNEQTGEMMESLMERGMPIDKNTLSSIYRQILANPQAAARTIVLLNSMDIPVTGENIAQFENYQNLEHQILGEAENLGEQIPKLFSDILTSEGAGRLIQTNGELLDIFLGDTAGSAATQTDGGKIVFSEEPGPLAAGEAAASQEAGETASVEETASAEETARSGKTPVESAAGESEQTPSGRLLLDVLPRQSARYHLAMQLKNLGASEELTGQIAEGEIGSKELLSLVGRLLKEHGARLPKEAGELLSGKEYQTLLKDEVVRQWLLEPKDVAGKEKVEDLYRRLDVQTAKVMQMLENLGKADSGLMRAAQGLKENVNFMNQLNQVFTYVQLPLKMRQENAHGDLYVYTNKKNLMKRDGNISALLHLDMEYLGPMDVYVAMQDGVKLNTHFYLDKEETIDLIEENIHILNERLEKRGYSMNIRITKREDGDGRDQEGFLPGPGAQGANLIGQYSFDVRA